MFVNETAIVQLWNISLSRRFIFFQKRNRSFQKSHVKQFARDSEGMDRNEMQELCEAQAQILQRMAGMRDCREELAVAQAANAVHKHRIAEQDARALHMHVEHTKYMETMDRSFLSMQADMQVFMDSNAATAGEQLNSYKQSLAQQDAKHTESVRVLTESFDRKLSLAEEQLQLARQELQDVLAFKSRTPTDMDADAPDLWSENENGQYMPFRDSTDAFLLGRGLEHGDADEDERDESDENDEITKGLAAVARGPKHAAHFKSRTDMWSENEDEDDVPSLESITAFLAGSGHEQYAESDESTKLLQRVGLGAFELQALAYGAWKPEDRAACEQWKADNPAYCETRRRPSDAFTAFAASLGRSTHAVWDRTYGAKRAYYVPQCAGLCAFELQALVYPHIGAMTTDIHKSIEPQFVFAVGERAVTDTKDLGMQPCVINRHTTDAMNMPTYTVRLLLDNDTVFRVPEHQVFKMPGGPHTVKIMEPLYERNQRRRVEDEPAEAPVEIVRTYPRTYPRFR